MRQSLDSLVPPVAIAADSVEGYQGVSTTTITTTKEGTVPLPAPVVGRSMLPMSVSAQYTSRYV